MSLRSLRDESNETPPDEPKTRRLDGEREREREAHARVRALVSALPSAAPSSAARARVRRALDTTERPRKLAFFRTVPAMAALLLASTVAVATASAHLGLFSRIKVGLVSAGEEGSSTRGLERSRAAGGSGASIEGSGAARHGAVEPPAPSPDAVQTPLAQVEAPLASAQAEGVPQLTGAPAQAPGAPAEASRAGAEPRGARGKVAGRLPQGPGGPVQALGTPGKAAHGPQPAQALATPAAAAGTVGEFGQNAPDVAPRPAPEVSQGAALVLGAMRALRKEHDPVRAARLLSEYRTHHAGGSLDEEALALAIEAGGASGDGSGVRFAKDYVARYPQGRFTRSAQAALASSPPSETPRALTP